MIAQLNIGTLIAQISIASITLFWIWMMLDAAIRQTSMLRKVLWFIGILLFYVLGALVYFFTARKNSPRDTKMAVTVIGRARAAATFFVFFRSLRQEKDVSN